MRPSDERGIADDCDPSPAHPFGFQIVDSLHKHAFHAPDNISEYWRKHTIGLLLHGFDQLGPDKTWGNAGLVMHAVSSGEHVPQLGSRCNGSVPHHIESPVADIDGTVRAGYRIADQFLAFREAEV